MLHLKLMNAEHFLRSIYRLFKHFLKSLLLVNWIKTCSESLKWFIDVKGIVRTKSYLFLKV